MTSAHRSYCGSSAHSDDCRCTLALTTLTLVLPSDDCTLNSLQSKWTLTLVLPVQEAVEALVRAGLRNPFRVNVAVTARDGGASTQKTPSTLHIEYLFAENSAKLGQALAFLRAHAHQKVIVYFLTCASVDYFSQLLPQLPGGDAVSFLSLHGHMKQRKVSGCPCNRYRGRRGVGDRFVSV